MTNARQVRQVFQPLVERHPDLARIGGRWLLVTPIHHVVRRVLIESTSHANYASPQWVFLPTFLLDTAIENTIGYHFWHFSRESIDNRYWEWSDPTMIDELIATIERDALPALRSIRTLDEYGPIYHKRLGKSNFEAEENRMIITIALGDLETAKKICLKLLPQYREDKHKDWWVYQNLRSKVVTVAEPLLADDRQELARILQGWEAANIKGTKFERYWEPTPFPLERA